MLTGISGSKTVESASMMRGLSSAILAGSGVIPAVCDEAAGAGEFDYYIKKPEYEAKMLKWKTSTTEISKKHLEYILETLTKTPEENFESVEKIKSVIFDYATEQGRGDVLWPLRVSLSGKEKSPDPFMLLYILGKIESLARIHNAILKLS